MAKRSSSARFLLAGIVCLALGIQLRLVESYVLRPDVTRYLARWSHPNDGTTTSTVRQMFIDGTAPRKVVTPPAWLGWIFITGGVVLAARGWFMGRGGKKVARKPSA